MDDIARETARKLRKNSTNAENVFWQAVRNRKVCGKKFLRQHPITFVDDGQKRFFVTDFYCHECKLAVELDGVIHDKQKEYDQSRSFILNQRGVRVVRFKNNEVENNPEKVLKKLVNFLNPTPPPL